MKTPLLGLDLFGVEAPILWREDYTATLLIDSNNSLLDASQAAVEALLQQILATVTTGAPVILDGGTASTSAFVLSPLVIDCGGAV